MRQIHNPEFYDVSVKQSGVVRVKIETGLHDQARAVLAIELSGAMKGFVANDPGLEVTMLRYRELEAGLLDRLRPELILAPLFAPGFDGMELAQFLGELKWRGRLRLMTHALPRPGVVRSELAAACPGADVDLIPFPSA